MGVAERSSDIILLTDREGQAIYVSPSFGVLLGLDRSAYNGRRPSDLVHPDDLDNMYAVFRNIAKTLEPASIAARTRKADGGYILIEYLAIPVITQGEFSGLQIVGRDMTEHQRVEEAYRETGRRMAESHQFPARSDAGGGQEWHSGGMEPCHGGVERDPGCRCHREGKETYKAGSLGRPDLS